MARSYFVVVALLLLAEVSGFEEGASNPGFVARITRKGLEYGKGGRGSAISLVPTVAHQSGVDKGTLDKGPQAGVLPPPGSETLDRSPSGLQFPGLEYHK